MLPKGIELQMLQAAVADEVTRKIGMPVITVNEYPAPDKSICTWINERGQASDDVRVVRGIEFHGVRFVVVSVRNPGFYDVFLATEEDGFQAWPPNVGDAVQCERESEIERAADQCVMDCSMRCQYDQLHDWIKACREQRSKA